jgi:hypothetical protein
MHVAPSIFGWEYGMGVVTIGAPGSVVDSAVEQQLTMPTGPELG